MKKTFLLIIVILLIASNLHSQDLIVTGSGDSINCKITKITNNYVYFTFKHDTEIRNTLLPVNQISAQQKNYFSVSELPAGYAKKANFPKFRFAIDGGWQSRLAKLADGMSSEWQEHYKKMKSGFHYDLQAAWFFNEFMGVEAMFSQQLFDNSLGSSTLSDSDGGIIASGMLSEQIKFNYFGANYIVRMFDSKKKNCFLMMAGFGYMGYNDRFFDDGEQVNKITAGTSGTNLGFGCDIGISESLALGFKLSFMSGSFRTFKQTFNGTTTTKTAPENSAEGLGTIKLSVGLRFNN
jgi:hypothetical protein